MELTVFDHPRSHYHFDLQARAVETAAGREEAAGGGAALSTEGPQGEGRGRGQQVQPGGLLGGDGHHL